MAYCGPRGIPLSTFLNWAEDDQVAAMAWMAEDNQRCSNCGTADWEWEEDPDFVKAEAYVCRGCSRVGQERKSMAEVAEHMPGMFIRLTPKEVSDGAH